MRFQLLDYCYGIVGRSEADDEGIVKQVVPEDVRVEPFDSLFEQRVFNRLLDRGYTVIPQYPASGYNIDLVVVGSKSRLAVECDGDTWHGPAAYEADLARQRDLERCGWEFFRIRESTFYVDQATALEGLWDTLEELNIYPSGWMTDDLHDQGEADEEEPVADDPFPLEVANEIFDFESKALIPVVEPESAHELAPSVAELSHHPAPATQTQQVDDLVASISFDGALDLPWQGGSDLPGYAEYTGTVAQPLAADRQSVIDGLLRIVAVEGPIVGNRLHIAYVRAAGGQRVGKQVARSLNAAIAAAVRQGRLIADDPLGEAGVKPRTYRLPDQPQIRPRQLGPRTLDQVPPSELGALFRETADEVGWDHDEALYRAALTRLGLRRLTTNVEARLAAVLTISRPEAAQPLLDE
jgi:very-short-patch-repair endonuclease